MGSCVSVNRSDSNEEAIPSTCLEIGFHVRKRTKDSMSGNIVTLHRLLSVPNRIITNGKTRSSCIFTKQGRKGINQDAMVVWEDFIAEDVSFFGVFDGHGPHGHHVAHKIRDALPVLLLSYFHSHKLRKDRRGVTCFRGNQKKLKGVGAKIEGTNDDKMNLRWREAFFKSYKAMDKELRYHPALDCFCSGSTAVTIVKQGSNLYIGNIGDSRAILGSISSNGSMFAIQLTIDLKPDLPREAERIQRCKGRVFPLQDEPEVPRVWLPFDDAPGLAMARAFGDFCLKEYGVISTPKYSHRTLTEKDQFIIIASDGVLDVLSNEKVVDIVSSASTRSSAARILVEAATQQWKLKYATSKADDCSVVCLFLDGKMDSESDSDEHGFVSATLQMNHSDTIKSNDTSKLQPALQRKDTIDSRRPNMSSSQRNSIIQSTEESNNQGVVHIECEGNEGTQKVGDENWSGLKGVTRVNSFVLEERLNS